MRIEYINLDKLASTVIGIGYEGEQNHTRVIIRCGAFFAKYPEANAGMAVEPSAGGIYPVALDRDGGDLIWDVSPADLAPGGRGRLQLTFTDGIEEDAEIIKSVIGAYEIQASLEVTGEAPDPIQNWIDDANAVLEEFGKISDLSASATTREAGTGATAEITTVDGHKNVAIGVPKGDTGETPDISVGTVETLDPEEDAYVELDETSTPEAPVFNFGIPKGETGSADNVYGNTIPMSSSDSTKISTAIGEKLDSDQGSANAGKLMAVGNDGELAPESVYGSTLEMSDSDSTKLNTAISGKLNANQGSGNAGKFMKVGNDGALLPAQVNGTTIQMSESDSTTVKNAVDGKLNANQGAGNAGKFMKVNNSGNVVPMEVLFAAFTGATASTDGTPGLVVKPVAGDQGKFLRGDATWANVPNPQVMTGATASAAGTSGLVPAPAAGEQNKVLTGGGTWEEQEDARIGDLANLETTAKSSVVAAINELAGGLMMTRKVTISSQSYTKGTYKSVSVDLRYSGYVPVAVIGLEGDTTSVLVIGDTKISNTENSTVTIWNLHTQDRSSAVDLTVLYVKA